MTALEVTAPTPFAQAGRFLLAAGYEVLPIPPREKSSPPKGYTGSGALVAGIETIAAWEASPEWGNVAVRLGLNMVGIDVDDYDGKPGAQTFLSMIAQAGPLPLTVVITARSVGAIGTRLYRVADGVDTATFRDRPGIDILRHGHRYALAPPSIHRDLGTRYRARDERTGEVIEVGLPPASALPLLPDAWVRALQATPSGAAAAPLRPALPLGDSNSGDCDCVTDALAQGLSDLRSGISRHDSMLRPVAQLARFEDMRHTGADRALDTLRRAFLGAVTAGEGSRTPAVAEQEWARTINGARDLVARNPTPATDHCKGSCRHTSWPTATPTTGNPPQPVAAPHVDTSSSAPPTAEPPPSIPEGPQPLDWPTFWSTPPQPVDFLARPLVARGRLVDIVAPGKAGKSLLALEAAAAIATGGHFLGAAVTQARVLYVDQEMTPEDLRERLDSLGYGPGTDLSPFVYYQLQQWPPLDTEAGGQAIVSAALRDRVDLVVVDTRSKVTEGPEDAADTQAAFYRHTQQPMKAAGIGMLMLDHTGLSSPDRARGSSAKAQNVDAVWALSVRGKNRLTLKRTHCRYRAEDPDTVFLVRTGEPLRHSIEAVDQRAEEVIEQCLVHLKQIRDQDPDDARTQKAARAAIRQHGWKYANDIIDAAHRRLGAEDDE